ncbi:MAG: hypothetical protein JSW50_01435, partial [Candidatus Latescibacterota bacterium]
MNRFKDESKHPIPLEDGARVVVVGGGPAGSFFAIRMLRTVKKRGKTIDLVIIEKKKELRFYQSSFSSAPREGCAYCAGGISPKLADALAQGELTLPDEILQGEVDSLTLHGDWKSIELPIPPGRKMTSVFRGAGFKNWPERHMNFDAFVLEKALEEGARVVTGEVLDMDYSQSGKPILAYRASEGAGEPVQHMEADFAVFAGGVNRTPGITLENDSNSKFLERHIPGFRPP